MKRTALVPMMLALAWPAAAATAPYAAEDCSKLTTQMDLNRCAADNAAAADTALNALYRKVTAKLDDKDSRAALVKAERAWLAYRDAECAYETGPQAEGGSIWPMEEAMCEQRMTDARMKELRQLPECLASSEECTVK